MARRFASRFLRTFVSATNQKLATQLTVIPCGPGICNGLRNNGEVAIVTFRSVWQQRNFMSSVSPKFSAKSRFQIDEEEACTFIQDLGYSREVAQGVVDTLKAPGSGCSPGGVLDMAKILAGRPEVGEDAGLGALAAAVEVQRARQEGKAVVRFHVTANGGRTFTCEGYEGMTITDVAQHGDRQGAEQLGQVIECACSGIMACSTCQVVVHPDWFGRVGDPDDDEQDMLDLAYDPQPTSRLACQVKLTQQLDGLAITVPDAANNLFDHIPFE